MKNEINKPETASGAPDVHRGLQTVTIGGIRFENPYFLAPLAGITDAPFRRICRRVRRWIMFIAPSPHLWQCAHLRWR